MAQVELFKNSLSHHSALSAALVAFIQTALRVSFLLNGGAIIAALSVYGARGGEIATWSLGLWVVGLVMNALAVFCVAKGQREFQVSASYTYRQHGRDFFGLDLPEEPGGTTSSGERGNCWRDRSWRFWGASIGAFVFGAIVAISSLG